MSDFKLKQNTGFIFKNKHKSEDKHPEYRGTINVDGIEKEISLWVNREKGYFSAKIQEPYKKEEKAESKDNTDLPF
jgi:hypothetical protein